MDGAKLAYVPPKPGTSGNAQVYKVEGGTTGIKEIQYSPSTVDKAIKSTHVGEYYKVTYTDGSKAKIIDPSTAMALGAALIASTPQGQEAWQKVAPQLSASVREDVQKLAVYLLLLNPGSPFSTGSITTLPIADLGPLRPLGYPADNGPDKADPGSSGYGAGGKVELPASTGDSRTVEPSGSSMTTPAEADPSLRPGAMINENGQHGAKGSMKAPDLGGVDDCIASQTQNLNRKLGEKLVKDDCRLKRARLVLSRQRQQ